jgi:cytochrome c biogenesis protein ResB
MNNTETLTKSDTQDTGQNKQFLIVTSVYSSVYFVMCLVDPMLSVSLCCLFLIVPSVTETLITLDKQDT